MTLVKTQNVCVQWGRRHTVTDKPRQSHAILREGICPIIIKDIIRKGISIFQKVIVRKKDLQILLLFNGISYCIFS